MKALLCLLLLPAALWGQTRPTGVSVESIGSGTLLISWTDADATETYRIERRVGQTGAYAVIAQTESGDRLFYDATPELNKEYGYIVRAVLGTRVSSPTPVVYGIVRPPGTGVGVGLLAGRPQTCDSGAGYAAVDGADWRVDNNDEPDVELFRCPIGVSAGIFELYYVAFGYPHRDTLPPPPPPPPVERFTVNIKLAVEKKDGQYSVVVTDAVVSPEVISVVP